AASHRGRAQDVAVGLPAAARATADLARAVPPGGRVAGAPVGAVNTELVASLGTATVLGVSLAQRGYLGAGWTHLAVVAGLAGTAAILSYVTQKYLIAPNALLTDIPEVMARTQQMMPAISAIGLVVAGGVVPVALLVYWVCNAAWTLGQSPVVWHWF